VLWMVDRLRTSDIADRDLPYLAEPAERLRYSETLRNELLRDLDPDLVEQYFCETRSNLKPRPSFSLPWSATPELLPPGRDFLVRLSGHPQLVMDSDSVEVRCGGRRWRFPRSMQWIIEQLDDGAPLSIGRLMQGVAGRLDEETVRLLVGMLVKHDLAAIDV